MTAPMSSSPSPMTEQLRGTVFPWVLALITGLDYFDNVSFSFFTRYIAGGINASPDELVWSSSIYAVAALFGILQQQWWVNRFDYRRYIAGGLLLYAAGALLASFCNTPLQLMWARGLQGYAIGPMQSACRIMIEFNAKPPQRISAIRAFVVGLVGGSALAPLCGGMLVAHFDWRMLFACTAPIGVALAGLAWLRLPGSPPAQAEEPGHSHLWPYLLFAFAQGALQIATQQLRYGLFTASPLLMMLTLSGVGALLWFVHHQWHHPAPLIHLHALRQRPFQVIALFIFYYAVATGFSYLISLFLEQGLNYPVENAGRLVGVASLISGSALFLYFRSVTLQYHRKWLMASGFAIAAWVAWRMTQMPPDIDMNNLILPMLCSGLLLACIALPVSTLAFSEFAIGTFAHSYRLQNIVRQLTISFATASIIMIEQHRQATHQLRLAEWVNLYNPEYQHAMHRLLDVFTAAGYTATDAQALAMASLGRTVAQQAVFLASLDGFYVLMYVALCGVAFALWQKPIE